jgi:hypothetical protein
MADALTLTNIFGYRTAIAEWCAIAALIVSAYAAVTIRSVRAQILSRVHLPRLSAEIEKVASKLADALGNYDNDRRPFQVELARCEAYLKILIGTAKDNTRVTAKDILKRIRKFNKGKDEAWEIYTRMNMLIEELKHALENQRYGG